MPSGKFFAIRLLVIGFLMIIFLFPVHLVQGLIVDRNQRQDSAVKEVSSKWGDPQAVVGPILVVPYYLYGAIPKVGAYIDVAKMRLAYFVPETLKINGDIKSQIRTRGIYQVPLYEADLKVTGKFGVLDLAAAGLSSQQMFWDKAYVAVGGLDLSGLKSQLSINWNGRENKFTAGSKSKLFSSEIVASVALAAGAEVGSHTFSLTIPMRGSQNLFFIPVGKSTEAKLASDWPSPSFDGAFLPTNHEISSNGFTASWQVFELNRNLPNSWTEASQVGFSQAISNVASNQAGSYDAADSQYKNYSEAYNLGEFGVRFFRPVDVYHKSTRAAKYAMAVIGLVFMIYFLVEAAARRRVNPLQYILVGLALCIFYTLLLSLSEYIAFGLAYLIASAAVVGMIGLFTKSILQSWRLGIVTALVLVFLYGFIFILLQSKDYTLLIGSIGLFIILGVIMYFSRYINWYGEEKENMVE